MVAAGMENGVDESHQLLDMLLAKLTTRNLAIPSL
jgi:hypothetical protein